MVAAKLQTSRRTHGGGCRPKSHPRMIAPSIPSTQKRRRRLLKATIWRLGRTLGCSAASVAHASHWDLLRLVDRIDRSDLGKRGKARRLVHRLSRLKKRV